MPTILYASRNPNPRLAVAVARHLGAAVDIRPAKTFDPAAADYWRALNPTRLLPILVTDGQPPLWEADAIACHLSWLTGSDFWRQGAAQAEMIRWISWGKENFVRACDTVNWERATKRRYGIGPTDEGAVEHALKDFHRAAQQLDAYLTGRDWLVDGHVSHADFRMATTLPYAAAARLPIADYPAIAAWADRLMTLPAWADPFAGVAMPDLPAIPADT